MSPLGELQVGRVVDDSRRLSVQSLALQAETAAREESQFGPRHTGETQRRQFFPFICIIDCKKSIKHEKRTSCGNLLFSDTSARLIVQQKELNTRDKLMTELQEPHLTFDLVIPSGHTWYCSKGSHSKNRKSIQKCKNILMFVGFCFFFDFKLVLCASGVYLKSIALSPISMPVRTVASSLSMMAPSS